MIYIYFYSKTISQPTLVNLANFVIIFFDFFLHIDSHQVAVIASNFELAEMIQNYKSDDIGECYVPASLAYFGRIDLHLTVLIFFTISIHERLKCVFGCLNLSFLWNWIDGVAIKNRWNEMFGWFVEKFNRQKENMEALIESQREISNARFTKFNILHKQSKEYFTNWLKWQRQRSFSTLESF